MQRIALSLVAFALIGSPLSAQTAFPPQGLGGQGMGGSAAFANPFGAQTGNMGMQGMGMQGMGMQGMNGSGFVSGGQGMGGRGLSMNQYMGMMMMRGLAGRNGSNGPRTGVANPFVTPQYPSLNNGANNQQMSLQQPKTYGSTPKMTPEERKATVRRVVEERKAKADEAAAKRKAKAAAQKKAPAKKAD